MKKAYGQESTEAWKNEVSSGMREALKRRVRQHRKPVDDDRPPPSTFTGARVKPIAGQLDVDGNEFGVLRMPAA